MGEAKSFEAVVACREKPIWSGRAFSVEVPAFGGAMTFLPGHQSSLILLQKGRLKVSAPEPLSIGIGGGFVSFEHDQMVVAVDGPLEPPASG